MAHVAKLSLHVRPAVTGEQIQEGRLVRLTASGLRRDLPTALLAASGVHLNVYVAFAPPDDFARPTDTNMYTAPWYSVMKESDAWGVNKQAGTFLYEGLSLQDNPIMGSGYLVQAHKGGIYHVPSGCVVDSTEIKVVGNLVKVSDDGTGRWEYTASEAAAIGKVVDYNPEGTLYTFELGFDS
jgi:hypothetical protein